MFPVFFSVSSSDINFAEDIWERFPDNWIYLYSKTGEEGAHMWDEIARKELPQSRIFVVFWSRKYVSAGGCVKEILQAKDLVREGRMRALVLRLDDCPLQWDDSFSSESKEVFEAFKQLLDHRTSAENVSRVSATRLVQRVAEPILKSNHPRLPRHNLMQSMEKLVHKDQFNHHPAIWVSGFNGVGRETLCRELYRNFAPNASAVVVDINEAALPKQVLLRIESEAFRLSESDLDALNADSSNDSPEAVAKSIKRVFDAGSFVVFRHNRIVEERVELPEWINSTVTALTPQTRPMLFILSQLPLSVARRSACKGNLASQRIATIDDHRMAEYCPKLIAYFDQNPNRWSREDIDHIVKAAGGNVGFLVALVRAASQIEDFDQIDELLQRDSDRMAESITAYVRWASKQLENFEDEQKTLLFLNDISPCDAEELELAVQPERPILRVLGKLLDLGLVERENSGLYRLTPLLANRLNRDLIRPEIVQWLRSRYANFVAEPLEIQNTDHEFIRIEMRIQAALWSGAGDVPENILKFVSASHWFQAGIRLFHARHREPAFRMLQKASEHRQEFTADSRIELDRYHCLSAIQNKKYHVAEKIIERLDGAVQTQSMSAFLRANMLEQKRHFPEAIHEYEKSISLNQGKNSRLERTYRPLIKCILSTNRPNFSNAERHAKNWLDIRHTVFSLMTLARVYLQWKYRGATTGNPPPRNIDTLVNDALQDLAIHRGVGSAHLELLAEDADFRDDIPAALGYMEKAIEVDPRFELRSERWRLMARSGIEELSLQAINELEAARLNPEYKSNWNPFLTTLAETYAIALKNTGQPLAGRLDGFAVGLPGKELAWIVKRVNRS